MENYNPDFIIIFPWNIADEVVKVLQNSLPTKTKFVTAIPEIKIL